MAALSLMNSKPSIEINSIEDIHQYFGLSDLIKNPLISVIDFSKVKRTIPEAHRVVNNLYCVLQTDRCDDFILYGQTKLDFSHGTLVFFKPDQVTTLPEAQKNLEKNGWALYIHPDYLRSASIESQIHNYSYFDYDLHEALHISPKEKSILVDLVNRIDDEISNNIDRHSQELVVATIELLLKYCDRFYDRQFITRKKTNHGIIANFEKHLHRYISQGRLKTTGMITVKELANQLAISSNYLGDLLKKETGKNASEHIQFALVNAAKNRLVNFDYTIKEIAYDLGFEYAQSFSKMFKNVTGHSPSNFRMNNLN